MVKPTVPPVSDANASLWWLIIIVGLGADAVLVAWPAGSVRPASGAVPALQHTAGSTPGPADPRATALSDQGECAARLRAIEAQIEQVMTEVEANASPVRLHEVGAPNPRADATLAPLIAQTLAGDGGSTPDYTLSCRGLVCRLDLLEGHTNQGAAPDWIARLSSSALLAGRFASRTFGSSGWTTDVVTKQGVLQRQIFLRLVHADGAASGSATDYRR